MNHRKHGQEGMALMLAILAGLIILGAVTVVVNRLQTAKARTDESVNQARLDEALKAGVDFAIERIWNQYITGNGNTTGNLASYLLYADSLVDTNEDVNGNGVMDEGEFDSNGDGTFTSNPAGIDLIVPDENFTLASGERIERVNVMRTDDLTGTTMHIRVTARVGQRTASAVQTVRVAGELFQGFEFGILANNINCILCHAEVNSLDLFRNTDPQLYGSFDRVKVAALESLMIRTNEDIRTRFAGTTYTRGTVYNQAWSQLSASQVANSTFKAFQFDTTDGKITQDGSGGLTVVSLANAGTDINGNLQQFANLYLNYPTDTSLMTDGTLPTTLRRTLTRCQIGREHV